MPRIYVDSAILKQVEEDLQSVSRQLDSLNHQFNHIIDALDWDVKSKENIRENAKKISKKLESEQKALKSYAKFLADVYKEYAKLENYKIKNEFGKKNAWEKFVKEFADNYTIKDVLKGSNYINRIIGLVEGWKNTKRNEEENGEKDHPARLKNMIDIAGFASQVYGQYKNYKKVGKMVGGKTAAGWFMKNAVGLKKVGYVSKAQKYSTRFANNLTNKTSPFKAQWTDIVDNFKGANGVGKAFAAWAGVALTGVSNWKANKEEQALSGGEMSDARVIKETVVETGIDTLINFGAPILVGAAVAALSPVALPGIVVTAASGAIVAGIQAGVKAITGKSFTEWASDSILDLGDWIGSKIGSGAKKANKPSAQWSI